MSRPPWFSIERAARGWYIFAVGEGGIPLYKLTRGPFKTEAEAREALLARLFASPVADPNEADEATDDS